MSEAFLSSLEKAFRCHIYGVKPKRNVYQVRTNRGSWIVKSYRERERAYWVTQLAQTLNDQGFYKTVHYVSSEDGQQVYPFERRFYTVMKTIDGQEATYSSDYDIRKAATTLAQFHQAAHGIPFMTESHSGSFPLLDKWDARVESFDKITKRIARKGPENRLEQLVAQMMDDVKEGAYETLEQMRKLPFEREMYHAYREGTLAHRDVASHNFLITSKGNCYLIDLDTVHSDMQLVDLAQFMSRMLLLQGYQMNAYIDALHAYMKVRHLSDTQIRLLTALLQFPDNFLREVTGLYGKRSGYKVRGVTQLLQVKRRFWANRKEFLRQAKLTMQYSSANSNLYEYSR
ncbi:phosphotransferase [Brevibacillus sp. SYSU BS000544]|uniref:phosphotransferase n=1 Tax=Brevibacillus sp. SYSU BS000544 TaxID=3416443 RepID=UPI003CE4E451